MPGGLMWLGLFAAGLLAAAAAVRILNGPVDLSGLKDWQPLMASVIALCAAGLAYRAATSKVEFDRDVARKADISARLGLLLRLSQTVAVLRYELRRKLDEMPELARARLHDQVPCLKADELDFSRPEEIAEAWSKIEMVPPDAIHHLTILRAALRQGPMQDRVVTFDADEPSGPLAEYFTGISKMEERATSLLQALSDPILELQQAVPHI